MHDHGPSKEQSRAATRDKIHESTATDHPFQPLLNSSVVCGSWRLVNCTVAQVSSRQSPTSTWYQWTEQWLDRYVVLFSFFHFSFWGWGGGCLQVHEETSYKTLHETEKVKWHITGEYRCISIFLWWFKDMENDNYLSGYVSLLNDATSRLKQHMKNAKSQSKFLAVQENILVRDPSILTQYLELWTSTYSDQSTGDSTAKFKYIYIREDHN